MPHIKYSDLQVKKFFADFFNYFKTSTFTKFGQFLPTEEQLKDFDAEELSDIYSGIADNFAHAKNSKSDPITTLLSIRDSKLIADEDKKTFEQTVQKSKPEEVTFFLDAFAFPDPGKKIEANIQEVKSYSERKTHSLKTFSDSLNMLNARKERTNFFGRKVKNSDEFTAVMDALEKLNNAPYNDNNEEVENAKKACEAYIASHKNPLSTIGRDRLNIINTLNERLKLSMEEVNEMEEAKKTWTRDDVSVDPQRVDKYAKMIMLTNDVRLENILDTSKDQTYANACLQASNLLKDAYLKNDTKELDALKEKCAFALSKSIDSFEGKVILDKGETIDFENKGKDW